VKSENIEELKSNFASVVAKKTLLEEIKPKLSQPRGPLSDQHKAKISKPRGPFSEELKAKKSASPMDQCLKNIKPKSVLAVKASQRN
jgi:hypothetical protein